MNSIIKYISAVVAILLFSSTVFAAEFKLPQVTALFGYEIGTTDYVPQKTPVDPKQADLWKAIGNDIDELAGLVSGQIKKAGAGSGADVIKDAATILHKIKEKAETLYSMNPEGSAEKGILGSSIVGEFFYPNYYQFIAVGQTADTASLDRAIALLKDAKKDGHFPAASRDLAVAYTFQRKYKEAFNEYKNVLGYFPDKREYAEAVVFLFALQVRELDGDAKIKLAKEYSTALSKWLSKTKSAEALDYLFLAKIYNAADMPKKVAQYIREGLAIYPDSTILLEAKKAVIPDF